MIITMNYFLTSLKINFILGLRNKQTHFFIFFLPLFLFILSSFIFLNPRFSYFSISTLIILGQGLYSIGPIIKRYQLIDFDKLLKLLPKNVNVFYLSLIISRFLIGLLSLIVLSIIAYFLFSYFKEKFYIIYFFKALVNFVFGIIIFGNLSIFFMKFFNSENINLFPIHLTYYLSLFLGGIFFPVDILPNYLKIFSYIFPTTYMMLFFYSSPYYLLGLVVWLVISVILNFLSNAMKILLKL
ncbi:MAG: ABC transporter permease [candidate division WOR-3 bacterium]